MAIAPLGGDAADLIRVGAAAGATTIAVVKSDTPAEALGGTGIAAEFGEGITGAAGIEGTTKITKDVVEGIPIVGEIAGVLAVGYDVFSTGKEAYECMRNGSQ